MDGEAGDKQGQEAQDRQMLSDAEVVEDASLFSFYGQTNRRQYFGHLIGLIVIVGFVAVTFRLADNQHCVMEPVGRMGQIYLGALGFCVVVVFLSAAAVAWKRLRGLSLPTILALIPAAALAAPVPLDRFGGLWACGGEGMPRIAVMFGLPALALVLLVFLVLPKGRAGEDMTEEPDG